MRKIIILGTIFVLSMLILSSIAQAQTCDTAHIRNVLRKALFDYFKDPSNSKLDVAKIRDLLVFYLSIIPEQVTVDCSGIGSNSGTTYDIIVQEAGNVTVSIPVCSDGTEYGECSTQKPGYCYNGRIKQNCETCGCLEGNTCQTDGKCGLNETQPPPVCGDNVCGAAEICEIDNCCAGVITNFTMDNSSCGGCGISCQTNERCIDAVCTYIGPLCGNNVCDTGETCKADNCCSGGFVNFTINASNCGGCGVICQVNETCVNEMCTPNSPVCGNNLCEINLGETNILCPADCPTLDKMVTLQTIFFDDFNDNQINYSKWQVFGNVTERDEKLNLYRGSNDSHYNEYTPDDNQYANWGFNYWVTNFTFNRNGANISFTWGKFVCPLDDYVTILVVSDGSSVSGPVWDPLNFPGFQLKWEATPPSSQQCNLKFEDAIIVQGFGGNRGAAVYTTTLMSVTSKEVPEINLSLVLNSTGIKVYINGPLVVSYNNESRQWGQNTRIRGDANKFNIPNTNFIIDNFKIQRSIN